MGGLPFLKGLQEMLGRRRVRDVPFTLSRPCSYLVFSDPGISAWMSNEAVLIYPSQRGGACYLEGVIDAERGVIEARHHCCYPEKSLEDAINATLKHYPSQERLVGLVCLDYYEDPVSELVSAYLLEKGKRLDRLD